MKNRPKFKLFIFTLILSLNYIPGFSTVMGPIKIDILGFDEAENTLYFTRTDWGECDCQTDLYIYKIDNESTEIISDWSSRTDYSRNRDEIIINKGYSDLVQLDTIILPDFISFKWGPEVKYYSKINLDETISLPFIITVFGAGYNYYQCSKKSGEPKIINLKIDEDSGVILIQFQGDCFEGNWRDSLIYYSKKSGFYSRKLISNDVIPLDSYKIQKK
jgi:hypothetical protein